MENIIYKISRNLTSGSEELLFTFLKGMKKARRRFEKEEILYALQKIIEAKPQMAVFYKAMELYAKADGQNVKDLTDHLILKLEQGIPLMAKYIQPHLSPPVKILTHSNSSTVIRVISRLKNGTGIKMVYCTDSEPGSEGKKTEKSFKKAKVPVERIPDTHILRIIPQVNAIFVGADAIFEDKFFNKVGTRIILELAKNYDVKSFLISSSLKISDNLKHLQLDDFYFEEIPLRLVDCIVTEEECRCQSSI